MMKMIKKKLIKLITYKKRASLMLEVLFSIVLLGLVAVSLLSNFYNLNKGNKELNDYNKLIDYANSKMEELISKNYRGEGVAIGEDTDTNYSSQLESDTFGNAKHLILLVKDKKNEREIKFEIYLKNEGIFSN